MAKKAKPTAARVTSEAKHGVVIRMTKRDCDKILKTLEHLKTGDPRSREKVRQTREAAQKDEIVKLITLVHQGLCMSCPALGKVVVVDIKGEK